MPFSYKQSRGFTLIELLIVVAIIAILAAIAIPNFLEAQIRSKVARVKADIRTVATGLEAYRVDYNRYPLDTRQSTSSTPLNSSWEPLIPRRSLCSPRPFSLRLTSYRHFPSTS